MELARRHHRLRNMAGRGAGGPPQEPGGPRPFWSATAWRAAANWAWPATLGWMPVSALMIQYSVDPQKLAGFGDQELVLR